MGDLIVVAAALFGVVLAVVGLGWLNPRIRARFAGDRPASGRLPGVALIVGGLALVALALGGVTG